MANETIHDQPLTTSADAADEIALWVVASGLLKRITKANLLGGVLTGAGVLATGGYTLIVPANGTVALLGTAQTFAAAKQFDGGILVDSITGITGTVTLNSPASLKKLRLPKNSPTIVAGAITPVTSYERLTSETGTTDDLTTINGGTEGDLLIIRPNTGHTITVKDGTGNIQCAGDFVMDSLNDLMMLLCLSTGGGWNELSRSSNI